MANVIAAPKYDVIANSCEWLNSVVFKNETVVADRDAGEDGGLRADVADQPISLLLDLPVDGFTKPVHALRGHRGEETKPRGRIDLLDCFESHDGQALERPLFR